MRVFLRCFCLILSLITILTFSSCSKADKNYGVSVDEEKSTNETAYDKNGNVIMATDRIMANYFDVTLFDEENYANIYLGKKFKIDASFVNIDIPVPATIAQMNELGWSLHEGNTYDANSLVFSHETIDIVLVNQNNVKLYASFFNKSNYSKKLSKCNIVKFRIDNDFYLNNQEYNKFNINGITNTMAITDIINTLGTPSHFYKVSDTSYYLDYFISKSDRRNGITIFINPVDEMITSIEFSYYK